MEDLIKGMHHVTSVSGDTQENVNFYTDVLGLRLVKKTVNFDDPRVYHFYFGDETGTPGSLFTSFPYGRDLTQGRHGKGKINTTAFSLTLNSLNFWQGRLDALNIAHKHPQQRLAGEVFMYLEDPDGLGLELVFNDKEQRPGYSCNKDIPEAHTIRGLHHIEIWPDHFEKTAALLTTVLDHRLILESAGRFRYGVQDLPGQYIDILWNMEGLKGLSGRGMVHHVAFATPDHTTLAAVMEKLHGLGLKTTEVKDRKYFSSVYFTEPGGVIFEVATLGPGFTVDEDITELGGHLQLPALLESRRTGLSTQLPPFNYPVKTF